jgi:cytochrome c556
METFGALTFDNFADTIQCEKFYLSHGRMAYMATYKVTLTDEEREELHRLIQKGGKGYRIRHAQILLKLDKIPENAGWTYDKIKAAYGPTHHDCRSC